MKKIIFLVFLFSSLLIKNSYSQCNNNLIQNGNFSNSLNQWSTFSGFVPPPINNTQSCLDTFVVLRAYNNVVLTPPQDGDGMYQPASIDSGKCYNLCMCMSAPSTSPLSYNNVQFWAATNDPNIDYTSLYNNTYAPDSALLIGVVQVNMPNPPQQYCINGWYAPKDFSRLIIFNSTDSATSEVLIDNICFAPSLTCAACDSSGLTASFVANGNGTTVQFTSTSTISQGNIIGYEWNFGDIANAPNDTSTQQNPLYNFSSLGTYFVCLKVFADVNGVLCIDSICIDLVLTPPIVSCDTTGLGNNFTFTTSNDTAFFTGISANAVGWTWNFGDPTSGLNDTSTLQNPFHAFTAPGSYNVCLIIAYAGTTGTLCYDTICKTVVIVVTNITEHDGSNFKIYPNPTKDYITITGSVGVVVSIYDLNGKLMQTTKLTQEKNILNITQLSKGIYLLKNNTNEKFHKLVKY
jgi:PKD repeat protein